MAKKPRPADFDDEYTRAYISVDGTPDNADWTKHRWHVYVDSEDEFTEDGYPKEVLVDDMDKLLRHLKEMHMTPEEFKKLPLYKFHVNKPGFEWLKEL